MPVRSRARAREPHKYTQTKKPYTRARFKRLNGLAQISRSLKCWHIIITHTSNATSTFGRVNKIICWVHDGGTHGLLCVWKRFWIVLNWTRWNEHTSMCLHDALINAIVDRDAIGEAFNSITKYISRNNCFARICRCPFITILWSCSMLHGRRSHATQWMSNWTILMFYFAVYFKQQQQCSECVKWAVPNCPARQTDIVRKVCCSCDRTLAVRFCRHPPKHLSWSQVMTHARSCVAAVQSNSVAEAEAKLPSTTHQTHANHQHTSHITSAAWLFLVWVVCGS